MGLLGDILSPITTLVGKGIDLITGNDSSSLQQQQGDINKDFALWNMENVTKPVYSMENEEYDRRFSKQQDEWNRQFQAQNEYNSPENQVALMRQAGLNPAGSNLAPMAAGGGQLPNPTVNEAASAMANPPSIFEAKMTDAQSRLADANAIATLAKAKLTEREIREKTINMETLRELNEGRVELQNCEIETQKSNQKLTRQKVKESKALVKQIDSYSKTLEKQIPILDQQLKNAKEEFYEIQSRRFLNQAQEANTDQKTLNLQSEKVYQDIINKYANQNQKWLIKEAMGRYNLSNAQATQCLENAKLLVQQGEIKDWEFQNTKERWTNEGQWTMKFNGTMAEWKYNNANMFQDLENSEMKFHRIKNNTEATFYLVDRIIEEGKKVWKGINDFTGFSKPAELLNRGVESYMDN